MSSLRDKLSPIPQHPGHHPEGDVFTHTRMVRQAMPQALTLLKQAQQEPNSSLSGFDFDLTPEEVKLLRASAWFHDIGKAGTTTLNIGGQHFPHSKGLEKFASWGSWQSLGHSYPKAFKPQMRELQGTPWEAMWNKMSTSDKSDLFFIVKHHMGTRHASPGFGRGSTEKFVGPNGKYKNTRRIKLLIVILVMDALGRGIADPQGSGVETIQDLEQGATKPWAVPQSQQSQPAPDDPTEFLKKYKSKSSDLLGRMFQGKFGREPTEDEVRSALGV